MNLIKFLTTVTSFSKILAAVLFIALPFAGFYLGIKYEAQFTQYLEGRTTLDRYNLKPTPSKTQDASTANWKTYTNSTYGYTVKIPGHWTVSERNFIGNINKIFVSPPSNEAPNRSSSISFFVIKASEYQTYNLSTEISTQAQFTAWLKNPVSTDTHQRRYKIGTTTINDTLEAVKFVSQNLPGDPTEPTYNIGTWIHRNGVNYYIDLGPYKESAEKLLPIYDQVISTFKFTTP
ncbi:hypothetical protein HYT32_01625 [Candidatus Roizmanbacteria bacterium]|nr:hypothetical protein [Candidatus Roizmanbacteria bacterium]